jgi:hypothetical protein
MEVAMTVQTKRSGSRVRRWFRKISQRKAPYRWYEVDHVGM